MAQPEWQIVGEAWDGFEVVRKAAELCPDLVLLDIGMPVMNGAQAAVRIREASRVPKIVFLTQDNDIELRSAALNTGAEGYVLKANAATELLPNRDADCPSRKFKPLAVRRRTIH